VISSDAVGVLPIKLGVPITEWQLGFTNHLWHIRLEPDHRNGLTKISALDVLQLRALAVERFVRRKGGCGRGDFAGSHRGTGGRG